MLKTNQLLDSENLNLNTNPIIPSMTLPQKSFCLFEIEICNFVGVSERIEVEVEILEGPVPSIEVREGKEISVYRRDEILLHAKSQIAQCADNALEDTLIIEWEVIKDSEEDIYQDLEDAIDLYQNFYTIKIEPFALHAEQVYQIGIKSYLESHQEIMNSDVVSISTMKAPVI